MTSIAKAIGRGAAAGVVAVAVAAPTPAAEAAGNIFPAGCGQIGYEANWGNFCWTGISYNRTGTYVGAVQELSRRQYGLPSVAVDCIYGPNTAIGVNVVQSFNNIPPDGIVGTQTWPKYRSMITLSQVVNTGWGFWFFHGASRMPDAFKYQTFNTSPWYNAWYWASEYPIGTPKAYGNMNTQDIQNCRGTFG